MVYVLGTVIISYGAPRVRVCVKRAGARQPIFVTEALTGDHHFEQAGFLALLKCDSYCSASLIGGRCASPPVPPLRTGCPLFAVPALICMAAPYSAVPGPGYPVFRLAVVSETTPQEIWDQEIKTSTAIAGRATSWMLVSQNRPRFLTLAKQMGKQVVFVNRWGLES